MLGALWIEASHALANHRRRVGLNRIGKFAELMALTTLCVMRFLLSSVTIYKCNPKSEEFVKDKTIFRQMNCPDGYYNQVGTLLLNLPGGVGFNILYWEKAQNYDPVSLLIAGVAYHIFIKITTIRQINKECHSVLWFHFGH